MNPGFPENNQHGRNVLLFPMCRSAHIASRLEGRPGIVMREPIIDNAEAVTLFPGGEFNMRFNRQQIKNCHAVVLGDTSYTGEVNNSIVEMYLIISNLIELGAASVDVHNLCFGYGRQERAGKPWEGSSGAHIARMFDRITRPPQGMRFHLYDLHNEAIRTAFSNYCADHGYLERIVIGMIARLLPEGYDLANIDAGRLEWVRSYARKLEKGLVIGLKVRSTDGLESFVVTHDLNGRTIVVCDDMFDTGRSFLGNLKRLKDAGAGDIYGVFSHMLSSNDGMKRLRDSGLVKKVLCTDTVARAYEVQEQLGADFVHVESVADLVYENIRDGYVW